MPEKARAISFAPDGHEEYYMKKNSVKVFAVLLLVACVYAQKRAEMSTELRSLVETERAFSRTSAEKGMKDAFITFAAADGLIFRGVPVNARQFWRNTDPAPKGLLTWQATYADISSAGDLGWTTGPYEFREKPTDKDAVGHGHFVTVWRRQPDGSWKFELDIGNRHPAPASSASVLRYPVSGQAGSVARNGASMDLESARKSLFDAEQSLARDASSKGIADAFRAHADVDVRLVRQNAFPAVGLEAARAAIAAKPGVSTWKPLRAGVARSGDLGYAYGTYESRENASDAKPSEHGIYMRIWKKQHGDRWKIVLEITNPAPPPAPATRQ